MGSDMCFPFKGDGQRRGGHAGLAPGGWGGGLGRRLAQPQPLRVAGQGRVQLVERDGGDGQAAQAGVLGRQAGVGLDALDRERLHGDAVFAGGLGRLRRRGCEPPQGLDTLSLCRIGKT